ncbi:hypothetical protein C8R43DRAFT_1118296 [Mycena crocata]|nr:hypothetical protein C8R43DRAFT_1118296 [Mycena crocata]
MVFIALLSAQQTHESFTIVSEKRRWSVVGCKGGGSSVGKNGGKTSSIIGGSRNSITSYNNGGGRRALFRLGRHLPEGRKAQPNIRTSHPGPTGEAILNITAEALTSGRIVQRARQQPGGVQSTASFPSNSTGTIFRVVSDNSTVADLMGDCSMYLVPAATNTVAPSIDGYNNSAVFAPENSTVDTPLPAGINMKQLDCLAGGWRTDAAGTAGWAIGGVCGFDYEEFDVSEEGKGVSRRSTRGPSWGDNLLRDASLVPTAYASAPA